MKKIESTFSVLKVLWLLLIVSGLSCGSVMYNDSVEKIYSRSDLMDAFRHTDTIVLIYGVNDIASKNIADKLKQENGMMANEKYLWASDDQHADISKMSKHPMYILGTTQENILIQQFQNNMPYKVMDKAFMFNNQQYSDDQDLLNISMYPNPHNNAMPVTIIMANSLSALSSYIASAVQENYGYFFWASWGYQVYREDKRIMLGYFSSDSANMWSLDKEKHWEFDYTGHLASTNTYFRFIDHISNVSKKQWDSLDTYTTRNLQALENFTGKKIETRFDYHLYPTTEIKGLMLNNTDQSNVDFQKGEVHAVYENEFHENYSGAELLLATRKLLGTTQLQCLESGIATMFNSKWCEHGYTFWAMKLYRSGNMPSLSDVLDNTIYSASSPYIFECTSALLVEFLSTIQSPEKFIEKYSSYTAADILKLEKQWTNYVKNISEKYPSTQESIGFKKQEYIKGFNFAHEGYQIYNGYLGSSATESLQQLNTIGANAISILPYGSIRDLHTPARFYFQRGAGAENDESIIRSAYMADKLQMSAMLKPQLWTWKGWTGEIAMQNEEDWKLFFQYYYEWIIHYAFLAELYHFDFFCIGVEFQNATLTHEKEWREIFSKVRELYSGKITYAANWGEEFENVTFWDQLDYISINCYYPLSSKNDVSDAELKQNFEQILDKIEVVQKKYNKPLLFTEIGFKSIDYPWLQPHADDDEQNYNEVSQQRCYEAMFEALEDEHWVAGVYLWQWPSYMEYVQHNPKGFTPCGKLAEQSVKYWFNAL